MNFDSLYVKQVDLLIDILPILNKFDCFALKGGTAINLFLRNMPRLSVDIDLTYLPIEPREDFLKNITSNLIGLQSIIKSHDLLVKPSYDKNQQFSKLFVYRDEAVIKIEPNFVIRGSVFDCEEYELCQKAQDQFLKFTKVRTLSFADIYGGKICAALDRQHPRDLFDIKLLFDNQGLTDEVRKAFIIYLISSPRPMHELLNPDRKINNFEKIFKNEFSGMTEGINVTYEELIDIRYRLIREILNSFTENEKQFLLSFKQGSPDWSLIDLRNVEKLPAVIWKLKNIEKIEEKKKIQIQLSLKKILNLK